MKWSISKMFKCFERELKESYMLNYGDSLKISFSHNSSHSFERITRNPFNFTECSEANIAQCKRKPLLDIKEIVMGGRVRA